VAEFRGRGASGKDAEKAAAAEACAYLEACGLLRPMGERAFGGGAAALEGSAALWLSRNPKSEVANAWRESRWGRPAYVTAGLTCTLVVPPALAGMLVTQGAAEEVVTEIRTRGSSGREAEKLAAAEACSLLESVGLLVQPVAGGAVGGGVVAAGTALGGPALWMTVNPKSEAANAYTSYGWGVLRYVGHWGGDGQYHCSTVLPAEVVDRWRDQVTPLPPRGWPPLPTDARCPATACGTSFVPVSRAHSPRGCRMRPGTRRPWRRWTTRWS
jgi:hypothetical protein